MGTSVDIILSLRLYALFGKNKRSRLFSQFLFYTPPLNQVHFSI